MEDVTLPLSDQLQAQFQAAVGDWAPLLVIALLLLYAVVDALQAQRRRSG